MADEVDDIFAFGVDTKFVTEFDVSAMDSPDLIDTYHYEISIENEEYGSTTIVASGELFVGDGRTAQLSVKDPEGNPVDMRGIEPKVVLKKAAHAIARVHPNDLVVCANPTKPELGQFNVVVRPKTNIERMREAIDDSAV